MDRLSSLPNALIEHILERLPQKDRVKTSILSTKWRLLWSQLPSLLLDREFHSSVCQAKNRPLSDYLHIITSILLQRKCHTRDVSFFIPNGAGIYNGLGISYHIVMKSFLYDANIQKLFVENNSPNPYRFPPSVNFSFVSSFPARLTHLQLRNCEFSPPSSFQGFPSLISFELFNCKTTSTVFSRFVSSCPTLQKLVLLNVNFGVPEQGIDADVSGLPHLCVRDVPVLRHLCVRGKFGWLFLINVDYIRVLDIHMEVSPPQWEGMHAAIPAFFDGMTRLEQISLGGRFCELLACHSESLKLGRSNRVRSLNFVGLHTTGMLVYAWNSIKRCTNLMELTISLADGASTGMAELKDNDKDYKLKNLVRVDFTNISGTTLEMKVIERLLCCTPTLKLMSVKFRNGVAQEHRFKYVREMMNFCRASNNARVEV